MSERLRESLSALMDDEADDLELGRILRAMDSGEADLGAVWSRYQLVSAVLKGSPSSVGLRPLTLDLAAADVASMDEAFADVGVAVGGEGPASRSTAARGKTSEQGRTRRALGSFAVAASITAVAVVGWQWQGGGDVETAPMAAEASLPAPAAAPVLSGLRATDQGGLLQASESGRAGSEPARMQASVLSPSISSRVSSSPVPTTEAIEADMRQQVEAYIIRHAEHNALHSRSGMMPFARMAAFDGAQ